MMVINCTHMRGNYRGNNRRHDSLGAPRLFTVHRAVQRRSCSRALELRRGGRSSKTQGSKAANHHKVSGERKRDQSIKKTQQHSTLHKRGCAGRVALSRGRAIERLATGWLLQFQKGKRNARGRAASTIPRVALARRAAFPRGLPRHPTGSHGQGATNGAGRCAS